ncbi:MAG: hypothetical protein Q9213_008181 [Squamulea squamosa]
MDLPPEIRNIIYEYCLVIPSEIVPYPTEAEKRNETLTFRCEKPAVALLVVSRQVRDEACVYLYGKNVWRLSLQLGSCFPTTVWDANAPLFRHITTSLNHLDITSTHKHKLIRLLTDEANSSISSAQMAVLNPELHQKLAHLLASALKEVCEEKLNMIQRIIVRGNLITLNIDFRGLFNPYTLDRQSMLAMIESIDALWQIAGPPDENLLPPDQNTQQLFYKDPRQLKWSPDFGAFVGCSGLRKHELVGLFNSKPDQNKTAF